MIKKTLTLWIWALWTKRTLAHVNGLYGIEKSIGFFIGESAH